MSKQNIYMAQPTAQHISLMPLPYAVGVLHAYILENEKITDNFYFPEYIFEKKPIQQIVENIQEPYAFFFSSYIWNYEYNKQLAKAVKEKYPNCKIVFGGHNVPMDYERAFLELPIADYILIGEGERTFEDLLMYFLSQKSKDELYNTAYRNSDGQIICNIKQDYVAQHFPSPYQCGLFDRIVQTYKDKYRFAATLETNRGCPFCCGYCDWGLNKAKLRFVPEEQIMSDIRWMAENRIEHCYGADSNFGMFERDLSFAESFANLKSRLGYPKSFFVSFSKQSNDRVMEIATILHRAGMLQGATLSFQSLNEDTLAAIGRKNLGLPYFSHMMQQYHLRHVPTYSELILGLPMETEESFKKGIGTLISFGQHSSIDVYECCLLPNSDLGQADNIQKYGIVSQRLPFRRFDVTDQEDIQEYSNIIVETSTMSKENWRECNLFSNLVEVLHFKKLFHCIALFLHAQFNMPYEEIYMQVLNSWRNNNGTVWAELIERISNQLDQIAVGQGNWLFTWDEQNFSNESFKNVIIKIIFRNYDDYISQLYDMVEQICHDRELANQLVRFQSLIIKTRAERGTQIKEEFDYDFCAYFEKLYLNQNTALINKKKTITSSELRKSMIFE